MGAIGGRMRLGWRRIEMAVGVAALVVGIAALIIATVGLGGGTPSAAPPAVHHDPPPPPTTTTTTSSAVAPAAPTNTVPASTLVATANGDIPGYPAPGGPADTTVPGHWFGYPSVLPVISTEPGWLDVRLAQRPNGSTTWVRESDVTLGDTPYAIVVNLTTMRLDVYRGGAPILDFPAGIGAPSDPTPKGNYFVTMQYPPPSPAYGPFVLVTSDHSNSITDWENSGDAIIAIHGPIDSYDDSLIGTAGAAISHGCIRLHDADLAQLGTIPAGTPVDVVS
jgi:lipoprotein-anchoring transpeptidase ErfK/SrfK